MIVDERPLEDGGYEGVFLVTAGDGRLFRCYRAAVGGPDVPKGEWEDRWLFEDDRTTYLGPRWVRLATLRELHQIVGEWWQRTKARRQTR